MSDSTPFLGVNANRIGAPGSPARVPFRATNAANWSSIIRIGAKMAVIRRQIARRADSRHTQRVGRVPYGESRFKQRGQRGAMPGSVRGCAARLRAESRTGRGGAGVNAHREAIEHAAHKKPSASRNTLLRACKIWRARELSTRKRKHFGRISYDDEGLKAAAVYTLGACWQSAFKAQQTQEFFSTLPTGAPSRLAVARNRSSRSCGLAVMSCLWAPVVTGYLWTG